MQVVPQAEVTSIHHLRPTNIVYSRHKHSDIPTELLHTIRQREFLAHFKTQYQIYRTGGPPYLRLAAARKNIRKIKEINGS